tara:strand:- start:42 stop:764 length:723 start_codon:yes stop_codon:yes gene_type:complete
MTTHHIDLWIASLKAPSAAALASDLAVLDANERDRVDAFRLTADAQCWLRSRATTKRILGRYLQCAPVEVQFTYSPQGRPAVRTGTQSAGPNFNLSHSGDTLLLAVSKSCAVGIDIEQIRPLDDISAIAARFFASREVRVLMAFPQELRLAAFFRCWSRKEAVIKFDGAGLSLPLDAFEVSLHDEPHSHVQWTASWKERQAPLEIIDVTTSVDHAAALAVPAGIPVELHWQDARVLLEPD